MTSHHLRPGDALELLIDHRGKTPKKLGGDWCASGHRVVSALNIKDSRVDGNDHHYVDDELYAKWMSVPLKAGDVLLTSEAPLGELAYLKEDADWCLGQRLFALRANPAVLEGRYLYYLLMGGPVRDQLISRATGSTVSGIRQAELVKLELDLPDLAIQREIAGMLGSLDDKIESNNRQVALLSQLFSTHFRAAVNDTRDTIALKHFAEIVKGVSYKSADLRESRTALVTLKSFDRNGGYKTTGLKPYTGRYKSQQVIAPGELAVAQTDLTQGAEVVGRAVRVPADDSAGTLVASLDLVIVRPHGETPVEYLYGILTEEAFRQHCRSMTSGTTVLHLASDAIPNYIAPLIPVERQHEFAARVKPLISRIDSLNRETRLLKSTRDSLLPDLIGGRLATSSSHRPLKAAL
jgi:type I restriction enzyme S subunit